MEVDRLSHHPCHRLSVPAAKLFWCRHCMEKFEDPISRWRHSKTCKTEGTLNMNKRKEQEAEAFKLFVESTTEPEQETEIEYSPQFPTELSPPEKVPSVTQQTGTDLNCFICKKEFLSLDEMRAHVRTPCNKQDKHSEVYSSFPFITESFRNNQTELTDRLLVQDEFDPISSYGADKSQSKEDVLIAKLLSHWSQEKVSYKQPIKEVKHKPPILNNSTVTSLEQHPKGLRAQPTIVIDNVNGDGYSSSKPVLEICSQADKTSGERCIKSIDGEIHKDFEQQNSSCQKHALLETYSNSQAAVKADGGNELTDRKRKFNDQNINGVNKRQKLDGMLSHNGNCTKVFSNNGFDMMDSYTDVSREVEKANDLKQMKVQNALEMTRDGQRDRMCHNSEDDSTIITDVGECYNSDLSNNTGASIPCSDRNDLSVRQSFEQSNTGNDASADVCPHSSTKEKDSVSLKYFRPVRTISSIVSPIINCNYTTDGIIPMDQSAEKEFTVLRAPETLTAVCKNQENKHPITKTCSSRRYKSVKVSKNKPKPVRAVIPVVNTGLKNTSHDDSDNDCIEIADCKYRTYPPSPAKTRSKHKDPGFCPVRSTARTLKPTQKKLELMVEQKSKVQPKGTAKVQKSKVQQSAIKDKITNKKAVKKSLKVPEKKVIKKVAVGKETKLTDKRTKPEKTVMFHQLKTEKSKSKPPKNLKCRLCDRVLDSVKQYQNHTRIPCKMKITRKWSQKVLRPNRSLPPSWKPKPGKRKSKDIKKPNLIPNNFRIHSQWEPSKRGRKTSKAKNRPASPQLSIVESSKQKRQLPHQQIEVSDLTEKEFFFYKLDLICSDDLPLFMCIRPKEPNIPQPLAVSIENANSENLSDCYISPPVLERIDIDEQVMTAPVVSTDLSFNLEPPHLTPAFQCHEVIQTVESDLEDNLLIGAHGVTMNSIKNDVNIYRNIFDTISVVKKSATDMHGASKDMSVKYPRCKILNSQNISPKVQLFSITDSNCSNISLNNKPAHCIGKEYNSSPKSSVVDIVVSPQRKEKRNLFESLGWEMLSENPDLLPVKTQPTCLPQIVAKQMDKNILGCLSKDLGIETSTSTTASPVENSNEQDKQYISSNENAGELKSQPSSVLQPVNPSSSFFQHLKSNVLQHSSSISPVSYTSPNRCNRPFPVHHSPVLIPSPRRPSVSTKDSCTKLYNSSIRCCALPKVSSKMTLPNSPCRVPIKEMTQDTEKCNQEQLLTITTSKSMVSNINHIVRKLQFNSYNEYANTCNISDGESLSSEASGTHSEEQPCETLSSNNCSHIGDSPQSIVQIHVLHRDESENSDVEELLADIVQKICGDPYREQHGLCISEDQCSCQNAMISDENVKDISLCLCAANKKCLSNKSCSREFHLESSVTGLQSEKGCSTYQANTVKDLEGNKIIGDSEDGKVNLEKTSDETWTEKPDESSRHDSPEVTVEYVDRITSEMLDDSHDVTYIIIEEEDVSKYIDSLKHITNTEDDIATSSFVSVS